MVKKAVLSMQQVKQEQPFWGFLFSSFAYTDRITAFLKCLVYLSRELFTDPAEYVFAKLPAA